MRADRLLSILILLQTKGRLTARELAAELEVSERTIYRDMDALSTAGIPVYAERGPGGGCSLLDSYRTNLTGLTRDEVRALFMLSIPTPLVDLGVDQDLKAALLKLSASLPDIFRPEGIRAQQRIHLDASGWFHQPGSTQHIRTSQQALWEDRKIDLTYHLAFDAQVEHLVEPYGLVAKANLWYLVFSREGFVTALPLPDVLEAKISAEKYSIPAEFNLAKFWSAWCARYEANRPHYPVELRMKGELLHMLKLFRDPILPADLEGLQEDDGWSTLKLDLETFETARQRLLNFGGAVEIIKPVSLRKSLQDFAEQIQEIYHR
jgi:predicted DNA-binding transcriptional regulator YafY